MKESINIEKLLHKFRLYRENIIYSESLIDESERLKVRKEIEELAKGIDNAIPFFRNPSCNDCANRETCCSQKYPNYKCYEIEWN